MRLSTMKRKALSPFSETATDEEKQELEVIKDHYKGSPGTFSNLLPVLAKMLDRKVPLPWLDKIVARHKNFKPNDSSSLGSLTTLYGVVIGTEMWEKKTESTTITEDKYIERHGSAAWEKLCASKASIDEASFIRRYGKEEGLRRRQEYLEKWTKAVKSKGGWDNGLSMESFITRHGEEKGYEMWNARRKNQRKRFSKEWFQNNHGVEWEAEWDRYCSRMADISAVGMGNGNCHTYSKKSQKLFWSILEHQDLTTADSAKFYEQSGEVKFDVPEDWGHYFYTDFLQGNKVIEFDGKYWHKKERAQRRDPLVDEHLLRNGYQILRINEEEYDIDPLTTVKKCVTFLLEEK